MTKLRLTYVPAWDFEDYKGWQAMCGTREEGMITWRSEDHHMVKEGDIPAGWGYIGNAPHHDMNGDEFASFEDACRAFEKDLFGGMK